MDRRIDALVAAGFVVLGLGVLYSALTLPESSLNRDAIGPAGLPIVLAAMLIIGGSVQVLRSTVWYAGEGVVVPSEGAEDDPDHPATGLRPLLFIAGTTIATLLLEPIGYLLVTPIAVGLGLWALDFRRPGLLLIAAVGYTVASFVIFSQYLGVPVPTGVLTGLLVDLGLIDVVR